MISSNFHNLVVFLFSSFLALYVHVIPKPYAVAFPDVCKSSKDTWCFSDSHLALFVTVSLSWNIAAQVAEILN